MQIFKALAFITINDSSGDNWAVTIHLLIHFREVGLLLFKVRLGNNNFMVKGACVCYNHLELMHSCSDCIPCNVQLFCLFNCNLAFVFQLLHHAFCIDDNLLGNSLV